MLSLPSSGIRRSISKHNSDLDLACDWLEASLLFHGEPISVSDVVDALCDGQIYNNQDFAKEFLGYIKEWLNRRTHAMPDYPIVLGGNRFEVRGKWTDFPEYSFLLFLSIYLYYPTWVEAASITSGKRGELFEKLCNISLKSMYKGWEVHPVGASANQSINLESLIKLVCQTSHDVSILTAAKPGAATRQANRSKRARSGSTGAGKDGGIDLWCHLPFPDQRGGCPILFVQCASGEDWKTKLLTPNIDEWRGYILFPVSPSRAMTIPYYLDDDDFRSWNRKYGGILLDRPRVYGRIVAKQEPTLSLELECTIKDAIDNAPVL